MQITKVNSDNPNPQSIKKAAKILKEGGLLVYPTDTAYGLGANALDKETVRKIYRVKNRSFSKPTHIVVKNWKMITDLSHPNKLAKKLYEVFMPGPLTLVLSKRPGLPDLLTAGLPTVGFRIPDNLITQSLSHIVGFPYTTPSANRAGGKTPYSIKAVIEQLDISKVDLALDAGDLPRAMPSTIADLSEEEVKILRRGPVLQEDIEEALGINLE